MARAARLLLLHAFPFDGSMWESVAGLLEPEGIEVVAPDLRGFGGTPLGGDAPDVERMVDDAVALLDEAPAVIGGCSMGGYVAMGIARRRPDLVAGLALIDTKATADAAEARANRERVAAAAEAGGEWSAGMLEVLLGGTTRSTRPDLVARVTGALAAVPPATVAWAQRAMATRPDSRAALAALAATGCPVVIAYGAEDALSPIAEQRLMAEALPAATVREIPGVGHLAPIEAPEAVAAQLRDVLRA